MPYHDITTCHDIYQHIVAALLVIMPTLRLTRDQTIQINEYGIKVAYMGSVSKYQSDMIAAGIISPTSDTQIMVLHDAGRQVAC